MNYYDVDQARREAENTLRQADRAIREAADLIRHRLRSSSVRDPVLCDLKRELQQYNMHTGKWSDKC